MKLGILVTGLVRDPLATEHGQYWHMFDTLYRQAAPEVETRRFMVVEGELPDLPSACDAWLVTGSKFGVYDPEPWIPPLKDFLRAARAAGVPQIGICFGHQIMAEAFGGRAEKSDKGWGCGVHRYDVLARPGWMADAGARFAMYAMHQDQVTALPGDAVRLAQSDFCPHAMIAYGDAEAPDAISIQAHPEFARPYAEALVHMSAEIGIPEPVANRAMASFGAPVDGAAFAAWSLAYLRRMLARRAAA